MKWFSGKPKIEGDIGRHGLTDWWLSAFDDAEREYIEQTYQPFGYPPGSRPLTKGSAGGSLTISMILSGLATWFRKPKDYDIAVKILDKSRELGKADILGLHFTCQWLIEVHYRMRDLDPSALQHAIDACRQQIAIAPQAAVKFKCEYRDKPLPSHVGYKQLVIILEKQGKIREAIELCEQAKSQGWNEDWDKRIARYQKKLASP